MTTAVHVVFSNLFLLTRVGQFFYFISLHGGMGLGRPDCITLYIVFTLFGSSWSDFCCSTPEGKTTLDVFYLFISLDWNGIAWISQGCHVTVVRVYDFYLPARASNFPFWQVDFEGTLLGCGLRRRLQQFPLPNS